MEAGQPDPGGGRDEPTPGEARIVGEARWPMAGAVLAAMLLTYLPPEDLRPDPRWVLPILEGVLLVAVVVADPGEITRRSALLRGLSIGLVAVLVFNALWTTVLLIDALLHGGKETNSASALLSAGAIVWVSNNIAFALLYWELDSGGAAARAHRLPRHADFAFPQQMTPRLAPADWRPRVHRLPVPWLHQRDRVQPDRHHAAGALGQGHHGGPVAHPRGSLSSCSNAASMS